MRIYFHLKNSHQVMLDPKGVEVAGPQEAQVQTLLAIEELRQEEEGAPFWSGWTLFAVTDAGDRLFTLDLDDVWTGASQAPGSAAVHSML